jgi:hypothetical protein
MLAERAEYNTWPSAKPTHYIREGLTPVCAEQSRLLKPVYTEYNIGNYARSFSLSSRIDQNKIGAELKELVLSVTLPKVMVGWPCRPYPGGMYQFSTGTSIAAAHVSLKLPLRLPRGPPEPLTPPCMRQRGRPVTAACLQGH